MWNQKMRITTKESEGNKCLYGTTILLRFGLCGYDTMAGGCTGRRDYVLGLPLQSGYVAAALGVRHLWRVSGMATVRPS